MPSYYTFSDIFLLYGQDAWHGSTGKPNGNANVCNITETPGKAVVGINACQHFDQDLLDNYQCYKLDPEETKTLWHFEIGANERKASSKGAQADWVLQQKAFDMHLQLRHYAVG
ncbi:hypothetical protein FA15DRAFT_662114 [Coprinopsis marcescibilis]|uniref:Uncharacterized protein n=1 Tax=Coprinopsis marcescibilis TaxID=230819 RepID=A0A5C3K8V0_COPMA|nr:hypothetical protein FA15DRAFT_662114 [Coprinopsis marcescibilis]